MMRLVWIAVLLTACGGKDSETRGREAAEIEQTKNSPRVLSVQDTFVGSDPRKLAFETSPLIGQKVEDLPGSYGMALVRSTDLGGTLEFKAALAFPGAPEKGRDLIVDLFYRDGVVESYEVMMRIEHEQALIAALTKTRGAPTGSLDAGGLQFGNLLLERKTGTMTTPWLKITVR
ncbi:MAG: hypothetical protein JWP01_3646 [Myxococcales bacterium]|nr:hypothetical protein [Myxococcales bacterium]